MSTARSLPALRCCPECDGTGIEKMLQRDEVCSFCDGERFVTYARAAQWQLSHGGETPLSYDELPDTTPSAPPSER